MSDYFSRYGQMMRDMGKGILGGISDGGDGLGLALGSGKLLLDEEVGFEVIGDGLQGLAGMRKAGDGKVWLKDGAGHSRDVYFPFAVHVCLAAYERCYERMSSGEWGRCEALVEEVGGLIRGCERYGHYPPSVEDTSLVLWEAFCLAQIGKFAQRDVDLEMVEGIVHHIIERPGKDGSLHELEADVTLDAWTYRELTGMHALAGLALLMRNKAWSKRVEEIGRYHEEHTQPDNTTNQPWGIFGFLWSQETVMFGEQQLHDTSTQVRTMGGTVPTGADAAGGDSEGGFGGTGMLVAGMLLADGYDQIRAFY